MKHNKLFSFFQRNIPILGTFVFVLIEYSTISTEALIGLAREYVVSNLSDTDSNIELEQWTDKVLKMIKNGELLIEYSQANESVYLKTPEEVAQADLDDG